MEFSVQKYRTRANIKKNTGHLLANVLEKLLETFGMWRPKGIAVAVAQSVQRASKVPVWCNSTWVRITLRYKVEGKKILSLPSVAEKEHCLRAWEYVVRKNVARSPAKDWGYFEDCQS